MDGLQAQRPDVAAAVGRGRGVLLVLQHAVGGEVVPEDLQVVEPLAADPMGKIGDVLPGCRQGQGAEGGRLGIDLLGAHEQAGQGLLLADLVDVLAELGVARHW